MADSSPTLKEWQNLYQAAIRIKEIAPWQWTQESDVFGVQDPETSEIGFVSIMGMMGEELGFEVKRASRLPSLDRAKKALLHRFG